MSESTDRRIRWGVTFSRPLADAIEADAAGLDMTPNRYIALLIGAVYDDVESVERLNARDKLSESERYKSLGRQITDSSQRRCR